MALVWKRESPAIWDEGKSRIVGNAPAGVFDRRFQDLDEGRVVPGEWWHAELDGRVVGYAWLDVVWGDAEIQLAVDAGRQGQGVGSFLLEQLEREANERGLMYLYNQVRPNHPDRERVTAWLEKRGFAASDDGSLLRAVNPARSMGAG